MSKNNYNYYVLLLKGEEPEIFTSWKKCEETKRRAVKAAKDNKESARPLYHGFFTKDEAQEFIDEKWRGKPISEEAATWLEEYKTKAEQLKQDTELDTPSLSDIVAQSSKYKYCAYVDGSYDPTRKVYGFGVVFICDGKIEKFYGGGKEKDLVDMRNDAGELLACMEAIKHAEALDLPKLTITCDNEAIRWAYYGCGKKMLNQAARQYMYEIKKKMELKVQSIDGNARTYKQGPGIILADKLARKGAGIVD